MIRRESQKKNFDDGDDDGDDDDDDDDDAIALQNNCWQFFLQFLDCICICICICVFVYFCISAKITELMMDHVSMQYNDRIQIRSILCVFFNRWPLDFNRCGRGGWL